MKRERSERVTVGGEDMRSEYNFAGGVRGKHHKAMQQGYCVKVRRKDGTTLVQQVRLEEGTVMLEPEVRKYFPNSDAVNAALRCLIPLVASRRRGKAPARD
jgi:hypothetical protein